MPTPWRSVPRRNTNHFPDAFSNYMPPTFKVYGVICIWEENILLVRGRRSQIWSFPKGHLKANETQLGCASRELKEESGIDLHASIQQGIAHELGFYKFYAGSYFLFAFDEKPILGTNDSWEIDTAEWVPLSDLFRLNVNVDVSWFRTVLRKKNQICVEGDELATTPQNSTLDYLSSRQAHHAVRGLWNAVRAR
jgi:8-oxo-dGTP pyrophosphatase MutT (NUDIX family)